MTEQEISDALVYVRRVTGMDPNTPPAKVIEFCIIDTAASYQVLEFMRAERERDGATAH